MDYGVELHPWDIAEDGVDQVLAEIAPLGVRFVSLTASWPGKAVVRPRASAHKLHIPERASVYFRPDEERWKDAPLRPHPSELVMIQDHFDTLPVRAQREGLAIEARLVVLPFQTAGLQRAGTRKRTVGVRDLEQGAVRKLWVRNAFGDRLPGYLCPAREEVRRYIAGLVADVARYGVSSVAIEDFGFPAFDFERLPGAGLVAGSDAAKLLMGLCFCESCLERGEAEGIETTPLAWRVRNFLEGVLSGEARDGPRPEELDESPDPLAVIDETLPAYVRSRGKTVRTLVADLRSGLRRDVRLVASPASRFPVAHAWRGGCGVGDLTSGADVVRLHGNAADADALALDVARALEIIEAAPEAAGAGETGVGLRLRAGPPGAPSFEALEERVGVARECDLDEVVFAGLGETARAHLDWIARSAKA